MRVGRHPARPVLDLRPHLRPDPLHGTGADAEQAAILVGRSFGTSGTFHRRAWLTRGVDQLGRPHHEGRTCDYHPWKRDVAWRQFGCVGCGRPVVQQPEPRPADLREPFVLLVEDEQGESDKALSLRRAIAGRKGAPLAPLGLSQCGDAPGSDERRCGGGHSSLPTARALQRGAAGCLGRSRTGSHKCDFNPDTKHAVSKVLIPHRSPVPALSTPYRAGISLMPGGCGRALRIKSS